MPGIFSSMSLTLWGLYYKTLQIHNLHKVDRFQGKLMSFLLSVTFTALDKHTMLLQNYVTYQWAR
jgi:hypothetical protein